MYTTTAMTQVGERGTLKVTDGSYTGNGDVQVVGTVQNSYAADPTAHGTILLDGKEYQLTSYRFPTVNPQCPNELTTEERNLLDRLHRSFTVSEKLRRHIRLLLQHGCMYAVFNNNLLFHASVPLNEDGSLKEVI